MTRKARRDSGVRPSPTSSTVRPDMSGSHATSPADERAQVVAYTAGLIFSVEVTASSSLATCATSEMVATDQVKACRLYLRPPGDTMLAGSPGAERSTALAIVPL
eukprot:scaffold10814_cov112-Isochrysis_galbana.AAC.2